jgi:hypothetical protein
VNLASAAQVSDWRGQAESLSYANPLEKPPAGNPEFIPSYRRAREEMLSLTEEEIRIVEGK